MKDNSNEAAGAGTALNSARLSNNSTSGAAGPNNKTKIGPVQPAEVQQPPPFVNPPNRPVRIYIDRDYGKVFTIRFVATYPPALCPRINQETFGFTINQLNGMFQQAEKSCCTSGLQSLAAFLTATLSYSYWDSKYEKCLKEVSKFIHDQNQRVYLPQGVRLIDPVVKGLRNFEIVVNAIDEEENDELLQHEEMSENNNA